MFHLIPRVIRRQCRQHTGTAPAPTPACVQPLERRQLLAAVGPVVAQQFIGPPDAVTAVVLTFDVPLDPASAANPGAYRIVRVKKERNDGPFGDGQTENSVNEVPLDSATYDPATNAVTVVPRRPFEVRRSFKLIRVKGEGRNVLLTAAGTPLDGNNDNRPGGDAIVRYRANARPSLTFREADGDRVTLRLRGPGEILYLAPSKGRSSPTLFFRDTQPIESVLTGKVKKSRRGDGVADIAQVSGTSAAEVPIAADPAFRIRALTP